VVVEAVQHYIDVEHRSAKDATARAMADISGSGHRDRPDPGGGLRAVGFIPGLVGRLYQQFAITIAISVLISAFVALR